jgi:hypothetical protein
MTLKAVQFLALIIGALALIPSGAHLAALRANSGPRQWGGGLLPPGSEEWAPEDPRRADLHPQMPLFWRRTKGECGVPSLARFGTLNRNNGENGRMPTNT